MATATGVRHPKGQTAPPPGISAGAFFSAVLDSSVGAKVLVALTGLGLVMASHINARPRFIFVAFPLVIALAKATARRPAVFVVLTAVFAASTVMLTVFYGLHKLNYYP